MRQILVIRPGWRAIAAITAAAGLVLLVAACSSGGSSSSGGGTSSAGGSAAAASSAPTSVLCQDAAALRTSLGTLTHVAVGTGSANQIKADLADVKTKLASFAAQAHGQWQAQTAALKTALTKLQTTAADLASHPSLSTVPAVVTALGEVTTAASSLLAAISTACPAGST
jgi:hypothetical protein